MESADKMPAGNDRRLQVYVDKDDTVSRVLDVAEGDYECVRVNSSWPDKGLIEGDMVLIRATPTAQGGDIVLLEEDGRERLGIVHEPGWLETLSGVRPLSASERLTGVGVALVRALRKD